jgi:prevent-host-death family protein
MDEMSIERARLKLGEIVDRARIAGQFTMITRQGKPAAVVVSVEWHEVAAKLTAEKNAG